MTTKKLKGCVTDLLVMEAEQNAVFWKLRNEEKYDKIFYKKGLQVNMIPVIAKMLELNEEIMAKFSLQFGMLLISNLPRARKNEKIKLYVDELFLLKKKRSNSIKK